MNRNPKLLFVACSIILISGCCKPKNTTQSPKEEVSIASYFEEQIAHPLPIVEKAEARQVDAFEIKNVRVAGDTLLVDVAFSGGCKSHAFEMSTNKQWLKSMPPQLHIDLIHQANQDQCRELVMGTLRFDLSGIRNPQSRSIQLILNQDTNHKILYTY
ncbi:MAG: hypothetical protein ACKOZY_12195 [Flavobacteriales bacterium]